MGKAKNPVVGVGEWLVTLIIMAIPLVNVVAVVYWAFADGVPLSKANLAKAIIVWFLVCAALYVVVFFVLGLSLAALGAGAAAGGAAAGG